MNKFQKEREVFFSGYEFSKERQQQVIERMQKKKGRPEWKWIAISFVTILFLLVGLTIRQDDLPTTTATFTEQSALATFKAMYGLMPEENLQVLDVKLPYAAKNDALVIAYIVDSDYVRVEHMEFVNEEWRFLEGGGGLSPGEEVGVNWEEFYGNSLPVFRGFLYDEDVNAVYIGEQRAELYALDNGLRFWVGLGVSKGAPIFYERHGSRERIQPYQFSVEETMIPAVEAVGNEFVTALSSNTMEMGDRNYTKYPVVIDPYYYASNRYGGGDVIVVNVDGEQQVTRLITEGNYSISIKEGTIVLNSNGQAHGRSYFWAHFAGDNTLYTDEQIDYGMLQSDEVFVMPDNWASDGIRGPIKKETIVGKVIGYSLMNLPEPWTDEEISLYKKFAKSHDERILQKVSPQQVLRMQRYAQYVSDHKTMYALYSKASKRKSFEEWFATANLVETKQLKQQLIYEAMLAEQMTLNEENNHLVSSKQPFTFKMEQENGVWKVFYDTVKVIYQ